MQSWFMLDHSSLLGVVVVTTRIVRRVSVIITTVATIASTPTNTPIVIVVSA